MKMVNRFELMFSPKPNWRISSNLQSNDVSKKCALATSRIMQKELSGWCVQTLPSVQQNVTEETLHSYNFYLTRIYERHYQAFIAVARAMRIRSCDRLRASADYQGAHIGSVLPALLIVATWQRSPRFRCSQRGLIHFLCMAHLFYKFFY